MLKDCIEQESRENGCMSDCEVVKTDVDDEMLCRLAEDLIYNYALSILPSLPRWLSMNLVSMS